MRQFSTGESDTTDPVGNFLDNQDIYAGNRERVRRVIKTIAKYYNELSHHDPLFQQIPHVKQISNRYVETDSFIVQYQSDGIEAMVLVSEKESNSNDSVTTKEFWIDNSGKTDLSFDDFKKLEEEILSLVGERIEHPDSFDGIIHVYDLLNDTIENPAEYNNKLVATRGLIYRDPLDKNYYLGYQLQPDSAGALTYFVRLKGAKKLLEDHALVNHFKSVDDVVTLSQQQKNQCIVLGKFIHEEETVLDGEKRSIGYIDPERMIIDVKQVKWKNFLVVIASLCWIFLFPFINPSISSIFDPFISMFFLTVAIISIVEIFKRIGGELKKDLENI